MENIKFLWKIGILFFFCGIVIQCNNEPKDISLVFNRGNISVQGKHASYVTRNGPMAASVAPSLKEPERGSTRLIVRNTRVSSNVSDNVFDIKFSSSIDIKGSGYYRLSKNPNSKIWTLEIDGDKVQRLSIIEGPATSSENYTGLGNTLIIFGFALMAIGVKTIPIAGIGCLIMVIAFFIIIIGQILVSTVS